MPALSRPLTIGLVTLGMSLGLSRPCFAQAQREQLLRLVPPDFGLCLVVQDLRGQADKLARAPWFQGLRQSPLGKILADAPEIRHLARFEADLQKAVGLDWAQLQADIFGNLVALAYRPGPPGKPRDEQGLLLVKAHDAVKLHQVVDRLNQLQKQLGELKELEPREHLGTQYFRRVDRQTTQFYLLKGPLFAFTNREDVLRGVIEQSQESRAKDDRSALISQLARGGGDRSLASLWLNPRAFEEELRDRIQASSGPQAQVYKTLLAYWQSLEAIVVSLRLEAPLELAVSLQLRGEDQGKPAGKLLLEPSEPADVWKRLPAEALVTLASRMDAVSWFHLLDELSPPSQKSRLTESVHKSLGAALGVDPLREVLPNLGPDWGLCVASAPDPSSFPHVLFALGVRPGSGEVAVDQALAKALQFFAGWAVFEYNRGHAEPFRWKTTVRENVEIRYVVNDKVLPAGLQPAFALKDGYLLLASSPEAVSRFHLRDLALPHGEAPLLQISPPEIARFLGQRRDLLVPFLAERNKTSPEQAERLLDGVRATLDLFSGISLVRRVEGNQVSWVVRLVPATTQTPHPQPLSPKGRGSDI